MFDGFLLEDFSAYLPEKWSSNMFTLPRRKVKDKLNTLGQVLAGELTGASLPLVKHLSDDHPSLWNKKKVDTQWLFFSRDEDAQKELSEIIDTDRTLAATLADPTPLYRHAFLGVSLDAEHLEVGLRLHYDAWVDRKNYLALILNGDGAAQSSSSFVELFPAGFVHGLVGSDLVSGEDLNAETLQRIAADFQEKKGWAFFGLRLTRDDVASMGEDVAEKITQAFGQLVPIYRFLTWSPSNDHVSIGNLVADRKKELEASQAELEKERVEREEKRKQEEERQARLRAEVEEKVRQDQEWRERERAMRRAAARAAAAVEASGPEETGDKPADPPSDEQPRVPVAPKKEVPQRDPRPPRGPSRGDGSKRGQETGRPGPEPDRKKPPRRENTRPEPARALTKVSDERKADIRVGDGVVVQKGFLKGRFGIVQSLEEKGDLKVVFGALTSRVPLGDVEGRGPAPDRANQDTRKPRRK